MAQPNCLILYVKDMQISTQFYRKLLQADPQESSPTFTSFVLQPGIQLGLWLQSTVEPTVTSQAGATELAFAVADKNSVDRLYQQWQALDLPFILRPDSTSCAHYACVALDPDGHRLRVIAPDA
ncbi:MAG: VOC family protein [Enterobacteriaceae bacterium]